MRLADLLVDTLIRQYKVNIVFTVTGGGAMYLNDAFGSRGEELSYISVHHEQTASMAAEAYAGLSGNLGVCQITTGPGGTNSISGCAGAWIDSKPIIFISGQVESFSLAEAGTRQTGVQEVKITELVKPITKAAIRLDDPYMVLYELDRLISIALSGRQGPVWIDIPLDLQNFKFEDVSKLPRYITAYDGTRSKSLLKVKIEKLANAMRISQRPLLCIGNGSRSAASPILEFAEKYQLPIVLGWNAKDFYPHSHDLVIGSIGQFGNRAANILTSKSDLIIGLGFRFSVPQIGYDPSTFAPQATIVSVDIDPHEIQKYSGFIDIGIQSDVGDLINILKNHNFVELESKFEKWAESARKLSKLEFDAGPRSIDKIDPYDFTDLLSEQLPNSSVIITDMGTSFTCTHHQIKIKSGFRLFTSSGLAAMGFGLPGAIGAFFAKSSDCCLTLITGDGGLMFNMQDLQTIVTYKIPLKIIIYENGGYVTMKLMQQSRFGRYVGSGPSSKVECVDYVALSNAFGILVRSISKHDEVVNGLSWLYSDQNRAAVLVVHLDPDQPLTPRVQTQSTKEGKLLPGRLEYMYPPLSDENEAMISQLFRNKIE
jgi:acetolactate synthase-1/2/3 large subunit